MSETTASAEDIQITAEVMRVRERVGAGLQTNGQPLLAIIGPCAPRLRDAHHLLPEGEEIRWLSSTLDGLQIIQRLPVWKPRTNLDDWHGEITTNRQGALALLEYESGRNAHVAIEFGYEDHVTDMAALLSFGWIGARNELNTSLQQAAAVNDPSLPLGVKNGLNGEIDAVLKNITRMKDQRDDQGGEIVLIYRGGENAKTPEAWERAYRDALDRTENRLIVDVAHGGEMAHDPKRNFTKSVIGQLTCLKHVLRLAEQGVVPVGIMMESTNAESPTDPVIPFSDGMQGIVALRNIMRTHKSNSGQESAI